MDDYEECKFCGKKGGIWKHVLECSEKDERVKEKIMKVEKRMREKEKKKS